jgi:hypothetical protein
MSSSNNVPPIIRTVICRWCPPGTASDSWQTVAVTIRNRGDAQDAANNACLYLIRDRQGAAEAVLVMEDEPISSIPDGGLFDAEEYDGTVTFAGDVVSAQDLSWVRASQFKLPRAAVGRWGPGGRGFSVFGPWRGGGVA